MKHLLVMVTCHMTTSDMDTGFWFWSTELCVPDGVLARHTWWRVRTLAGGTD